MIRTVSVVASLLAVITFGAALPVRAQGGGAKAQLDAIVQSLNSGAVASIEVFGVPSDAEFRVNVSPQRLEELWDFKLTTRGPMELGPRTGALTKALNAASIRPANKKVEFLDVRWGCVFYSATPEGKRIGALYFERGGRLGAVNNLPASFGPDFLTLLKKALQFSTE